MKLKNLTPEQEAEMERTERALCRADIYVKGVTAILTERPYTVEIETAVQILSGAVEIQKEAEAVRRAIRLATEETDPPPRKRRSVQ